MSEAVIVAIITGLITLIGTVLSVHASSKKTDENIRVNQAVTDTKLEDLTRVVMEHNGYARRLPVVEEQIKVINHRLDDLEELQK